MSPIQQLPQLHKNWFSPNYSISYELFSFVLLKLRFISY